MNLLLSLIITQLIYYYIIYILKIIYFLPTYPNFYGQGTGNRNVFFFLPYMNGLFIFFPKCNKITIKEEGKIKVILSSV